MMDETKQSDSSIVAMKRANKEGEPSAEPVERRDETKGNSVRQSTRRTQRRGSVSQAVDRIRRARTVWLAVYTQGRSRVP